MPPAPGKHKLPHSNKTAWKPKRDDSKRGSARDRGYTAAWDRFSRSFLRDHPLCEYCAAKGNVTPARVTDHDIPHRGDPDLFWDNTFTALCKACHDGPKARAEARLSGEALLRWVGSQKAKAPHRAGVGQSLGHSEPDRRAPSFFYGEETETK